MNSDDPLMQAFQRQQPAAGRLPMATIEKRVRTQRRWRRLQRAVEVLLSLAAIGALVLSLGSGRAGPHALLLLPFFAVFLPLIWWLLLRGPRDARLHAGDAVSDFARHRLAQLRSLLREAWLLKQAIRALLVYALAALALSAGLGDAYWRSAALDLLLMALLMAVLAALLLRRARPRLLREYRTLRRLLPDTK